MSTPSSPLRTRLTHFGFTLVCVWVAMVLYASMRGAVGLLTLHHYEPLVWGEIRSMTVYLWTPLLPLTPLIFWFASRFPIEQNQLSISLLRHAAMLCVFALLHGYGSALLYYYIGDVSDDMRDYVPWQHAGHFLFTHNNVFLVDALIYSVLVASQNLSYFQQRVQQHELDAVRLQAQLVEAKLHALQMQINPHFLFNTLNSLHVLIKKQDHAQAQHMLNRLSDFLRLTLMLGNQQWISLQQELDLCQHYLAIEQVRFGERLQVSTQVDSVCLSQQIPALLLQPLIENAIKHGLATKLKTCHLTISAHATDNGLMLQITDDGSGCHTPPVFGVGLRNVQQRLATLYGPHQQFTFASSVGHGTTVTLNLGTQHAHPDR